ncbi:MAG: hypothetical protein GKS02_09765 [Alphaproteobacteria bacterium]|nr:hypothetical protein [Alphaproteobacteria bacterium]
MGSWWEERRQIIQPTAYLINAETNTIMNSCYSDGPLGRLDASDVVKMVNFYESQKNK